MKPPLVIAGLSILGAVLIAMIAPHPVEGEGVSSEAPASTQQSQPAPEELYALIHRPGPAWEEGRSSFEQPGIDDHVQHFSSLIEQGKLFRGGPFLDGPGGMMVIRAESREEAERFALADPAVRNGLLEVEVRTWLMALRGDD